MFVEEYSRYTLLSRASRSWSLDKRTLILVCTLTLPVFIFCATYMTLFGIYDKILYPNIRTFHGHSLHRASLYNTYSGSANVSRAFYLAPVQDDGVSRKFKLVCYYNFPQGAASLKVDDLDPALCTHVNVGFAQIVNNSVALDATAQKQLAKVMELKDVNKDLRVLLTVGGAGNTDGFPEMVRNHTNRKSFIQSVVWYVKTYGIDGVDLDWEFPNEEPLGDNKQRMHFTQLLEELRTASNRQSRYRFMITVAVAAPTNIIDNSYDISYMNEFVDYVNLMSYDFHFYTKITPFTGMNAPLFAADNEKFYLATLNINYSSNYWQFSGMNRSKIVVGLPTYGHSFKLANHENNGLYAPASGYGRLGHQGFADYPQVCLFLASNYISPVFDMDTRSPYAAKYSEWVSFDDAQSLTYKAEYIRDNQFGGAMIYSLNSDDYRGVCQGPGGVKERFPLTKVVKKVLGL